MQMDTRTQAIANWNWHLYAREMELRAQRIQLAPAHRWPLLVSCQTWCMRSIAKCIRPALDMVIMRSKMQWILRASARTHAYARTLLTPSIRFDSAQQYGAMVVRAPRHQICMYIELLNHHMLVDIRSIGNLGNVQRGDAWWIGRNASRCCRELELGPKILL